jgi:flagellar protein FliS
MYQTGCNAYRQSAGNTLEDSRVVLLKLYDGILKFLAQARRGMLEGSPKIRGENISKIMAIITELECALDFEKGGEIAANLGSLYQYAMGRLTSASIANDVEVLDEVKDIFSTIKEGFEIALQEQKTTEGHKKAVASPAQMVTEMDAPVRAIQHSL